MIRYPVLCVIFICMLMTGCSEPANHKSEINYSAQGQMTENNRVPGQYVVILKKEGKVEVLLEVFGVYGIKSIKDISKDSYLLALENDPGPESVSKQAETVSDIKHVQPNYLYRSLPKIEDSPQRAH